MEELLEYFGEPTTTTTSDSFLWLNKSPFNSVFYKDNKIYISIVINKKDLVYPLLINACYSELKRLLIVNGNSLYNVLVSICLVSGIPVNSEDTLKEIYERLIN